MKLWGLVVPSAVCKKERWARLWRKPPAGLNEALDQYISALPQPTWPHLSARCVLRMMPPRPMPVRVIWEHAMLTGALPSDVPFNAFYESLRRLVPLFFSLQNVSTVANHNNGPVVHWQSWVPKKWRGGTTTGCGERGDPALLELCQLVPTYFVSSALLQEQISHPKDTDARPRFLEWEQLFCAPLCSVVEWSEDRSVVRFLSSGTHFSFGVGAANSLYGLQPHPDILRQVLNVLASLLPTFKVLVGHIREVYRKQFTSPTGILHSALGTDFTRRFPDAHALLDHPDVQFTVDRGDDGYIRLHPSFLHASSGMANSLYTCPLELPLLPTVATATEMDSDRRRGFRHCLCAGIPFSPRPGDEVVLRAIASASILGLCCTVQPDKDTFSLEVCTAESDVATIVCTFSSLCRLHTMGVPFCGFPAELVEALVSPSVVKIVSDKSTRFCSHGVAQPDGFSDAYTLLSTHLKVDFQCVCSIHQLALFVGLPVPATPNPGQLRLLYYRLITRGEVAVPPHLTPSLLGVLCAALLAGVYRSDGHAFDVNSFQQLLRDAANGGDALMIRNMRLRIERYGVRCAESLNRKSCEIMLQQLLSEHGPEICFMDRLTNDLRTIPGATDAVVSGQLQVQDGDEEYIGELLRDDCSSTAAGSHDEDMEQKEALITDDVPISIKKRTVESYGVENGDNSVMKNTEKPHKTPIHCRETASPEQGTGVPLTRSDGVGSNGNFELGNKTVEFVLSPPGFSQNFEKKSMGKGSVPLTFSKRPHNRPAALTEPRATGDFTSPALRPSVAMEGDTLTERCAGRTDGDPKHIESDGAFIERLTREVLMDTMEKQCAKVSRPVAGLRLALGKKV